MEERNNNDEMKPKITIWESPLQIEDVIAAQNSSHSLQTYLMSHLLAAGFRGSEYQLLVLLEKLTALMLEYPNNNFMAVFEAKNHGNLDDIGIIIRNEKIVISIDSYQVKYYDHPISAYDFYNKDTKVHQEAQESEAKDTEKKLKHDKNTKMHIGKFFDGWLSWKHKYQELKDEALVSIIYSNANLDEILDECVEEERFSSQFIDHQWVVEIGKNTKNKSKVIQKFLEDVISKHYSTKVWKKLQEDGILDEKGFLTG